MKVFILGGKGFIGSAFTRFCENEGIDYDCIDLDNYDTFWGQGCDLLINAAGNSKKYLANEDPVRDFRYSLEALLHSFFDFSFRKYVFISSIDVYPDHQDPRHNREDTGIDLKKLSHYGFHKYLGEKLVRHYISDWLIIRLGGVLGPGLKKNPVFDLLHDIPLRVDEDSRYQYLPTALAAEFVFELVKRDIRCDVFNLCGRGTISLKKIRLGLNKPLCYLHKDPPLETYKVNNEKISQLIDLPESEMVVKEFLI